MQTYHISLAIHARLTFHAL